MLERLAGLAAEYDDVVSRLSSPDVLDDHRAFVELSKRAKELEPIVAAYRRRRETADDLDAARDMLAEASGDDREFVRAQIEEAEAALAKLDAELRVLLLPKDANEDK